MAFSTAWNNLRKWFESWILLKHPANRIFGSPAACFASDCHAAVAIRSVSPQQRHLGILYKNEQSPHIRLLHLASDYDLREQEVNEKYVCVDPGLPPRRGRQLAARCRQIFRANGRFIPYGFDLPTDCFDVVTAEHLFGNGTLRTGLTCATFVLAVFEFTRIRLIRYETWRARPNEDSAWQNYVIENLMESPIDVSVRFARRAALGNGIGGFRFRPEEVAASAALWPPASDFSDAVNQSVLILDKLKHQGK